MRSSWAFLLARCFCPLTANCCNNVCYHLEKKKFSLLPPRRKFLSLDILFNLFCYLSRNKNKIYKNYNLKNILSKKFAILFILNSKQSNVGKPERWRQKVSIFRNIMNIFHQSECSRKWYRDLMDFHSVCQSTVGDEVLSEK